MNRNEEKNLIEKIKNNDQAAFSKLVDQYSKRLFFTIYRFTHNHDDTEDIINSYAYTPFGILANESETEQQPFKYVGKYGVMTEPNGFYYMRARYYDTEVGRFISKDPIAIWGNIYTSGLNTTFSQYNTYKEIPTLHPDL